MDEPFDHEMCLYCMTINDDMDAICLHRGRRRCQELPCLDFKHCENGAKEHELCKVMTAGNEADFVTKQEG